MSSFIACKFVFEEGEYTYTFQCYSRHPRRIDIIRTQKYKDGYLASLHHIEKGQIMWVSTSDYVSEAARRFGDRMVKLLAFT
jgi:hypothetical protein